MNRRDFTRSLTALGLIAAMPGRAMAASPSKPAFTPDMYRLGVHIARSTGLCSTMMLSQKLALPPMAATSIQAKLIRNGVISAPNETGIALTTRPYAAAIRFKI